MSSKSKTSSSAAVEKVDEEKQKTGGAKASNAASKRKINRQRTIEKYMDRMRSKPRAFFEPLEGAYLSTYSIYSTIHDLEISRFIFFNCFAVHLMSFARALGINVLGVTSERKIDGEYICEVRKNPDNKIVYVGKYSFFSNAPASPWAPSRTDVVYYDDDESSSDPTFVEYL